MIPYKRLAPHKQASPRSQTRSVVMNNVTSQSSESFHRSLLKGIALVGIFISIIAVMVLSGCTTQIDRDIHIAIRNPDGSIETHYIDFSFDSLWTPPVDTKGRNWSVYSPDGNQKQVLYKFPTSDQSNLDIRVSIPHMTMDTAYPVLSQVTVGAPTQWLTESGYFILESKNSSGEIIFRRRFQVFNSDNLTSKL